MAVATEKPIKITPESPSAAPPILMCCKRTRIHSNDTDTNDLQEEGQKSSQRRKINVDERKVRFNLTKTQFIENPSPPSSSSESSTWLSVDDYRFYQETCYKIAERIKEQANTFEPKYLSYESCIQRVLRTCLDCSTELHPTNQVILWNWATIGDVRRGLEKLSVPHVADELRRRKVGLIRTILQVQQNMTIETTSREGTTTTTPITEQDKAILFQQISQQYSKPSCLLAIALGKADEMAAKKEFKNCIQIQLPPSL